MSMNVELKAKWVEALRSGKYKQGKNHLRNKDDTFCCLGVLCDIVNETKWKPYANDYYYYDEGLSLSSATIPPKLRKEVGLDSYMQYKAMRMNDRGCPFTKIADMIERDA